MTYPSSPGPRYFSQCEEDKWLYQKYFSRLTLRSPHYFKAGALDGKRYSNTKFFADQLGWRGVLVEPNLDMFSELLKNRPNDILFNHFLSNEYEPLRFVYHANVNLASYGGALDTLSDQTKRLINSQEGWWKDANKNICRTCG